MTSKIKVYGNASAIRKVAAQYEATDTIEGCQTSYGFGLSFVTESFNRKELESYTHFTGSQLFEIDNV